MRSMAARLAALQPGQCSHVRQDQLRKYKPSNCRNSNPVQKPLKQSRYKN